jgi:hypothetical protein
VDADDRVVETVWPFAGHSYYGCVAEPGQPVFEPADFIPVSSR